MSDPAKEKLSNQIHDMVESENLILSDGNNSYNSALNESKGPLIGKASNDEMFSDTRNKMHNYVDQIVNDYDGNDSGSSSNKSGSGILLKLILFAIFVGVAALVVYFIYK